LIYNDQQKLSLLIKFYNKEETGENKLVENNKKKEHCEKIKEDKDKREFIKKSLLGIGTAGIVAGVLTSPLGSSLTTINTSSLNASSYNLVSSWNADLLDGLTGTDIRGCTSCSWTCTGSCTGNCSGGCTGSCVGTCSVVCGGSCTGGCTGSCTSSCGESCNGCTGP
jgi:modification target Cys-rich repeat protein